MHMMAYGGSKPAPFQQAIAQSQSLEPGITGLFTINAMRRLVDHVRCNSSTLHSSKTIQCLRELDMSTLLKGSIATYAADISHNIGDIWLPVVDGDFLPAAPSTLIREHRFANVTTMMGWCDDDVTFFTDQTIRTASDTRAFISSYAPNLSARTLDTLLALYPPPEFPPNKAANLSAEFYRSARILRDILMVCQPLGYAQHLASAANTVYLYDWNQTILEAYLTHISHRPGLGPIHTSEFAYLFANLSLYDTASFVPIPSQSDRALERRASRSWSTFASTGLLSHGRDTLQGFGNAFSTGTVRVFVVGGPSEGLWAVDGGAVRGQRLGERCAFLNSEGVVEQLRF